MPPLAFNRRRRINLDANKLLSAVDKKILGKAENAFPNWNVGPDRTVLAHHTRKVNRQKTTAASSVPAR